MTTDPRIGSVLAGFRIESLLGKGGMSIVYLAEQEFPKRWVALKLLSSDLSEDERFRERFVRESNTAASIDHPNIIPIYGAGEVDGQLFIAMRYVKGSDLKHVIHSEGALDPARALSIISQVAGALDVAHGEGLVHRDVKPGNILLASGPESFEHVYLSDFGLTKRTSSESGITGTGQFVGTLDYAAPEQFEGTPLDARADVYSLGCVTFECLTGQAPFTRDGDAALMYAHLMAPRPTPSAIRPELSVFDDVIGRAMARRPEDRYATAGSFANDLRAAIGVTSGALPSVGRRRARRRNGAIAVVVAAALAVAMVTLVLVSRSSAPPPVGQMVVANSLVGLDARTGKVRSVIPVGLRPADVLNGSGDNLWILNTEDRTISIVDTRSERELRRVGGLSPVYRLNGPGPFGPSIASGFGSIWVASDDEAVERINESTNLSEGKVLVNHDITGIATDEGSVWTTNGDGTVTIIDPSANRVSKTVKLGRRENGIFACSPCNTDAIAVGEGAAWVVSYNDGTITKIDAAAEVAAGQADLGGNPGPVAVRFGSVWVLNLGNGAVDRIAPATLQVTSIPIGRVRTRGGSIAFSSTSVWVTDPGSGNLIRIDPLTNAVQKIHVGFAPAGIAVKGETIWVTVSLG